MNIFLKMKNFYTHNSRLISVVVASVLSVLFIGSVIFAIFIGGEFIVEANTNAGPKGLMRLYETNYSKTYFEGESFDFDKEKSSIGLFVKDPALDDVVKISDLPANEYGFKVNGKGDIIDDSSKIKMEKSITFIDIVSKAYPSVYSSLDVMVFGSSAISKLAANYTYEAEEADIYKDDKLLTYEEKCTLPNTNKPFLSSKGDTVDGLSCSGGACLRSFGSNNMRVEFVIVSRQEIDAKLSIKICLRQETKNFEDYFTFKLNGKEYLGVNLQSIPKGTGYFTPYSLDSVTVKLTRGLNVFTFESGSTIGKTSPVNLDAIQLTTQNAVICGLKDIIGG